MSTATRKKNPSSAFGGLADLMSTGDLGGLTENNGQDFSMVAIDEILIKPQVREVLEDAENSLQDLADSIREHGVFQPVILRPIPGLIPFELVAGERRLRASILAGQDRIPAMVRELTDEQAEEIQVAENIQRKNLTQIEIARKLQADLDEHGGDVEALMARRQKSRAWISKWLSLLDLPEQARRVINENVSADLEVIHTVRQVENVDPQAAQKLVDDLKKSRGKENARDKAKAAKEQVKPPRKSRKKPEKAIPMRDDMDSETSDAAHAQTEKGEEQRYDSAFPTHPAMPPDAGNDGTKASDGRRTTSEVLDHAFRLVYEFDADPRMVLDSMREKEREYCENWLEFFYKLGSKTRDVSRAVLQGFRDGSFAAEGHGAFALAAFLYGADSDVKFNLLSIISSGKA